MRYARSVVTWFRDYRTVMTGSDLFWVTLACFGLGVTTLSASVPSADSTTTDPITNLIQYGVLGMVVIGFITGWIVPGTTARQLAEENKRLNTLIEQTLLNTIDKGASVMERTTVTMDTNIEVIDAVRVVLHELERGKRE